MPPIVTLEARSDYGETQQGQRPLLHGDGDGVGGHAVDDENNGHVAARGSVSRNLDVDLPFQPELPLTCHLRNWEEEKPCLGWMKGAGGPPGLTKCTPILPPG